MSTFSSSYFGLWFSNVKQIWINLFDHSYCNNYQTVIFDKEWLCNKTVFLSFKRHQNTICPDMPKNSLPVRRSFMQDSSINLTLKTTFNGKQRIFQLFNFNFTTYVSVVNWFYWHASRLRMIVPTDWFITTSLVFSNI